MPTLLPEPANAPGPRVIACAFSSRKLACIKAVTAKTELHSVANNLNNLHLKIKAAMIQLDIGNECVEIDKLQRVIGSGAAATAMPQNRDATSFSKTLTSKRVLD
jgi:hypothetical protein